jgi:hypothetical protein
LNLNKNIQALKHIAPQNIESEGNKAQHSRRYKLHELIAQCDLSPPMPEGLREWVDAPAVGKELTE